MSPLAQHDVSDFVRVRVGDIVEPDAVLPEFNRLVIARAHAGAKQMDTKDGEDRPDKESNWENRLQRRDGAGESGQDESGSLKSRKQTQWDQCKKGPNPLRTITSQRNNGNVGLWSGECQRQT